MGPFVQKQKGHFTILWPYFLVSSISYLGLIHKGLQGTCEALCTISLLLPVCQRVRVARGS